jgi:hypothetical protein
MQHGTLDAYLEHMRADELKRIARLWGGSHTLRKDECITLIAESLCDPASVKEAMENLSPFERNALALVNFMDGVIDAEALTVGLRMAGVALPQSKQGYTPSDKQLLLNPLFRLGLIIRLYDRPGSYYESPVGFSSSYSSFRVFSDPRLLRFVPSFPTCQPLDVPLVPAPAATQVRRPQTVLLDVLGILQTVHEMGGLNLTRSNTVRVNDARKLGKAMNWKGKEAEIDGLPFHEPAQAFAHALSASGLLARKGNTLHLTSAPEAFAARPYEEQIAPLVRGFLHASGWNEQPEYATSDIYESRRLAGRLALLLALAALPADTDGFFSLDALDEALFARIGETFSLGFMSGRPTFYRKTSQKEQQHQEQQWHDRLRQKWQQHERIWFRKALTSWAFVLGLVELGMQDQTPVSVRLTDLGRTLLHPGKVSKEEARPAEGKTAWVVQPTFEMIVYLDQATPQQLAFLERHAERAQIQAYTARYHLTRDSVYRALEQGASLDDMLAQLRAGAAMDLPQNVEAELHAWAALRERITVHHQARLAEFATQAARDAALQGDLAGTAVGERFILLAATTPLPKQHTQTIDYTKELSRCLYIDEDGTIELRLISNERPDLLIMAQLDRWAERLSEQHWQLTASSVTAALAARAELHELFDLLQTRSLGRVPSLLTEVLRCWAGTPAQVELATVTLVQCGRPELLNAIANSKLFRSAIRGYLGFDVLLVDTRHIDELREKLHWAGVTIGETIHISRV